MIQTNIATIDTAAASLSNVRALMDNKGEKGLITIPLNTWNRQIHEMVNKEFSDDFYNIHQDKHPRNVEYKITKR